MSDSCIFLEGPDGGLKRMNEAPYLTEADLQELLAQHPDLLAGDQIDSEAPRRWLLIGREVGIATSDEGGSAFALDHLFLDQDAIPTLVEVKRSSDTRIRREVVGQMLDYAANASAYWNPESLRARFEARCEQSALDPQEELAELLSDDAEGAGFWQKLEANLAVPRLRLLFVADQIPAELRRVIEFLNAEMQHIEVLGVEIKQYRDGDSKALVPRVLGQTEKARARKSSPRRQTSQSEFLDQCSGAPVAQEHLTELLAFASDNAFVIRWGTKGFSMTVPLEKTTVSLLEGYPPPTYSAGVLIVFNNIRRKVRDPGPIVDHFRDRLATLSPASSTGKGMRFVIAEANEEDFSELVRILIEVRDLILKHGLA